MTDACVRQELEHGLDHPQTGAKDRHDDNIGLKRAAFRALERRIQADFRRGQFADRFGRKHETDAVRQSAKLTGPRRLFPQTDERVECDRMIDEVHRHAEDYMTQSPSPMLRRPFLLAITGLAIAIAVLLYVAVGGQSVTPVSLVVTGGTVVTMNAAREVIPVGAVAVDGERIVAIGPADDIGRRYSARTRIDARGQIVMPGLINAHTHAPMVLFRGLADDLALMDWLNNYIFPAEARTVSPDFVRIGTRLAALEMITSGTTTFADMYYFEDDIANATKEAGLRGGARAIGHQVPGAGRKTPEEGLARAEAFIKAWKQDPLITPAIAPHAPYTVEAPTLKAVRALANQYGVPVLIHLAETEQEVQDHPRRSSSVTDAISGIIGFLPGPHAGRSRGLAGRR